MKNNILDEVKDLVSISGIKTVDLKIIASGNGVVNWNGTMPVWGADAKRELKNHKMPKLRGYTNETGEVKESTGYKYKKTALEVNFKETPLYVSQNCIRHHLFKDQGFDMHFLKSGKNENVKLFLSSIAGLLRGYVVPSTGLKRKSPLLIEDFVDQLGNGNFEQLGNSGEKNENSIFSQFSFGKTKYISHASISIEDLQFISLDKKFDRQAAEVKNEEGVELAKNIENFLIRNSGDENIRAIYGNYYRVGSIFKESEVGILLNENAIDFLVNVMIDKIESLSINQAKGYLNVNSVTVDYNDSKKMMRIIETPEYINNKKTGKYAIYYKELV